MNFGDSFLAMLGGRVFSLPPKVPLPEPSGFGFGSIAASILEITPLKTFI